MNKRQRKKSAKRRAAQRTMQVIREHLAKSLGHFLDVPITQSMRDDLVESVQQFYATLRARSGSIYPRVVAVHEVAPGELEFQCEWALGPLIDTGRIA